MGAWRNATRHHSAPLKDTRYQQVRTFESQPHFIAADRTGLAWQNTAYNQPPHMSFFIGNKMPTAPRPTVYTP
ncbi:hypothetical protein FPZ41_01495 [Streptomyces sp. K1PN6]|uniref:Rhamnogalacturonan lyase family 11 C-terminal domain-containing protein n=1 Tax=Streptomyces acidicola TaxID=2596892 RepID=A0A5N8WKH0_9ACTN|nr:hypothetical protein [Streptomyces acidicola]